MFASTITMQFLAVATLLFASVFANPIKRSSVSDDEATTPVRIPGVFGLFTTLATSALSTGETAGFVVVSSQTVYVQEPNFFPTTVWGVSETTTSRINAGKTIAGSNTSENTPYSFPTPTFPTPTFPTPNPQVANSTSATLASPIITAVAEETTSSCDSGVAGVTIPITALTTGEFVAAWVTCGQTIYVQEPNFYPTKTYYGISSSSSSSSSSSRTCNTAVAGVTIPIGALTTGEFVAEVVTCGQTLYVQEPNFYPTKTYYGIASSSSSSSSCDSGVAGVTIPVDALTTGEFVAEVVTCGQTIYVQEPNFYPTKTYYGIPTSTTVTSSVAASTTAVAIEPRMLEARTRNTPVNDRTRPTFIAQADTSRIESVPSGVAGNRCAKAFRHRGGFGSRNGGS